MATDAWGIDDGYQDVDGQWHDTPDATRRTLRVAMGGLADVGDPPPSARPVWFVREGTSPELQRPAALVLEDGTRLVAPTHLPPDLPIGYHDLHPNDGGPTTRLIVRPHRCHLPEHLRTWGWTTQLYATRSRDSWGIGDLADLRRLGSWSKDQGAGVLAINPLHAPLPLPEQQPSPYSPSTRRYRSPLYLRIEEIPGFATDDVVLSDAAAAGRELNENPIIDRDRVHQLKQLALERLWARFNGHGRFDTYLAEQGDELDRYATFCALAEQHGSGWATWPAEHRRPDSPGVDRFAAAHRDRIAFHRWVQWLLDEQLARAGAEIALLGDLAIGVDPDGADAWIWQDVLARGVRIGAPPDDFNRAGQDWGLPPFVPWRLRAVGYEPLAMTLRAALRHCGALRVDHVMGLFRLFWIPEGGTPAEGAYVRYRTNELLDVVAIESMRAGAVIVGEDLGTIENEVRWALHDRGVLSYRLVWFEDAPPSTYPAQALAAVTTHDLPTIAGVWCGRDAPEPIADRLATVSGLPPGAPVADVAVATYCALAESPSMIATATLEDALGVEERTNLPGTTADRPNWSIALPMPIEEVEEHPTAVAIASALDTRRNKG